MTHAVSLSMPPLSTGSIEQYIHAVNQVPMLSEEQELLLARRFRESPDLEAARLMVMSHLRLVVSIARNYLGYGLPHADLIQEGSVGLMKAVKRFDPDRGVRLASLAIHWIKAEIHEYILRNWRLVRIATTKAQRKLFFNLRSLRSGSQTLSSDEVENMARVLRVKPDEVREMETRFSGGDVALDNSDDDDESRVAPISYLVDPASEPSELLANLQSERLHHEGLAAALENLDERSRAIVARRWLDEHNPSTLQELAAEYGVSAERIRQIEAKALQRMRASLLTH